MDKTLYVTVIGWLVLHFLNKIRENRTRRVEKELEQIDRQIAELYGPVLNLIEQIWSHRIASDQLFNRNISGLSKGDSGKIRLHLWDYSFKPVHEKIIHIMETKMYLVVDGKIPGSFKKYLQHAIFQMIHFGLWQKDGVDIGDIKIPEWPSEFEKNIRDGFSELIKRRACLLSVERKSKLLQ